MKIAVSAHSINEGYKQVCGDYSTDVSYFNIKDVSGFWREVDPGKMI